MENVLRRKRRFRSQEINLAKLRAHIRRESLRNVHVSLAVYFYIYVHVCTYMFYGAYPLSDDKENQNLKWVKTVWKTQGV